MGDQQQQCNIDIEESLETLTVSKPILQQQRNNDIELSLETLQISRPMSYYGSGEFHPVIHNLLPFYTFRTVNVSPPPQIFSQRFLTTYQEFPKRTPPVFETFIQIIHTPISTTFPISKCFVSDLQMRRDREPLESNTVIRMPDPQPQLTQSNEHKNLKEILDVYLSMKNGSGSCDSMEIQDNDNENPIFTQLTPSGNTVLHIAAMYGNHEWIDKTLQNAKKLLITPNGNGDTALHVAARTQDISILNKLFTAHLNNLSYPFSNDAIVEFKTTLLPKNNQGNNFFHEALFYDRKGVMSLLFSDQKFDIDATYKDLFDRIAITQTNNEDKSVLYLAVEAGYKEFVDQALFKLYSTKPQPQLFEFVDNTLIDELFPKPHVVAGKSPLLAAIFKRDQGFAKDILERVPEWIHLKDNEGRTVLHHAASIGYLDGVTCLLEKCMSLASIRDNDGFFPLHLASNGGHVEVVERLVQSNCCPYPGEILDNGGRNVLHIAIQNGKFNVVKYILQSSNKELEKMINDKDKDGNTPLHYASLRCYPRIVYELTRDKRVNSDLVNNKHHTALVACMESQPENTSLRQRLTWMVLKSAGLKPQIPQPFTTKAPSKSIENYWKHEAPNMDNYKDRISTLLVVSTLITTAAFAAGFAMPGGINSSDPGKGMSLLLDQVWFNIFIFCITISMYGGISATIILISAQLRDISLAILSLKVAMPILGITLGTLSIAFLAGVHLVITDLTWLATTSMVLGVIFILIVLSLYFLLWLPLSSSIPIFRYFSKYPILFLAFLVDKYETSGNSKNLDSSESVRGDGLGN